MGLGLAHYIPLVAFIGFWIMMLLSLCGRPQLGFYYMIPFVPYRTMRDHFLEWPLGANVLSFLAIAVIVGALIQGRRLRGGSLYITWLLFAAYLYLSMWYGTAAGHAPAPLWLTDVNFVTWKEYLMLPLLLVAGGLIVQDRSSLRITLLITAATLFLVDKSALGEALSRSWSSFDEDKRGSGPLAYGSNQLAAYLVQFGMFFWGVGQFMRRKKVKLTCYALTALTLFTAMYTFSRAGYLAIVVTTAVLGLVKDRKLIVIAVVFLCMWQAIVPTAVQQRINMTHDANGQLEASAQERVDLWQESQDMFLSSPIFGTGYASFQYGEHEGNLKDTHNWYVKVLVETGLIGGCFAIALLFQMVRTGWVLFRRSTDPLYRGLGLGLVLAMTSCIVTNCFGDRWTYIEINGTLWILIGAALSIRNEAVAIAEHPSDARPYSGRWATGVYAPSHRTA